MISQREMKVMQFPSKYIQGPGAVNLLSSVMEGLGGRSLVLVTKSQRELMEKIMSGKGRIEVFGGEASYEEIDRVIAIAKEMDATAIAGVGGGKAIDTAKIAGERLGIPSVIVPTISATDAPCSGIAIAYTPKGEYIRAEYLKTNPRLVLVDTEIIAKAPSRFLVSGMGDAFATYLEAIACEKTSSANECQGGGLRTASAMALAKLCMDTLFAHGEQAKVDSDAGRASEAVDRIVEANTLLSGLGFESTGLAMCHAVANAFTLLPQCHAMYHGEKVAFGCLVELELYDPLGIRDKTFDFFKKVGLPVTLEDMKLPNATDEQLMLMATDIAKDDPAQYSHHEPYAFDAQKVVEAMRRVDERGKNLRSES